MNAPVFHLMILFGLMVLLVVALGLPLLLGPDSRAPAILSFGILAAFVAVTIWFTDGWWILLPIAALIVWVVRWDGKARGAPAPYEPVTRSGMSAATRLRFRLWCTANLAVPMLIAALFMLPAGSAVAVVLPGIAIAMTAMTLFRFSFYRSALRDYEAAPGPEATASPAASG